MKIEIKHEGEKCGLHCSLCATGDRAEDRYCILDLCDVADGLHGPDCHPGVYVLVPEAEAVALRELAEAAERRILVLEAAVDAPSRDSFKAAMKAEAQFLDALTRLRALSSPGIPDKSKGGGK